MSTSRDVMAKNSYPKLGATAWRTLRERAATAPSTKFTSTAVAAMLSMGTPESATTNVVGPMRRLGLIDNDGGLTARGNKWRIDTSYGEACQEILDEIYPAELASLTDVHGVTDRAKVTTWFEHQGLGRSNAQQMAATYAMIAEKKLPGAAQTDSTARRPTPTKQASRKAGKQNPNESTVAERTEPPQPPANLPAPGASIHLDIQIHIPADASADQIDRIFASMAKHLYQK
jgi:hypothetical protein